MLGLRLQRRQARRQEQLQARVTDIEEARRQEELQARLSADVRIRLEGYPEFRFEKWTRDHRIVIENKGAATARNVNLEILNDNDRGIIAEEDLLPLPELYALSQVHLGAILTHGGPYPLHARLTWRDGRGDQQREMLLTIQNVS